MSKSLTSVSGLAVAVRLKMNLLCNLTRSTPNEWDGHINRFIDGVAASAFREGTALVVLLADLLEEMRVLLNQQLEVMADNTEDRCAPESGPVELSKDALLEEFRAEVGSLLIGFTQPQTIKSPLVERVLRFIEEHYADPLSLDRLAAFTGRSKRYLATQFRQQTGQTVHSLLTQVRLHHAAEMIRAGEKIEVVSLLVGYRSKKNFYMHFKEQFGATPAAYRTAALGPITRRDLGTRREEAVHERSTGRRRVGQA
jgi:AraC-like DNA-binding protein